MEPKNNSSSQEDDDDPHPSATYEEIFMQQSLLFSDSLKDLRSIRSQLYSAAEFFEDSYHKNDNDQLLLESLKDYVSKALISTIDHLGSMSSKVNKFLDESIDEAYETNLRVLCIKQRLQTCQMYSDHEGLLQQSLVIQMPKYNKRYLLPDGSFSEALQAEKTKAESARLRWLCRRGHTERASGELRSSFASFSFANTPSNKISEKRSRSLSPSRFRIKRSGPVANQSVSPSFPVKRSGTIVHRSIDQNTLQVQAWRSDSRFPERDGRKDIQVYSKKTKSLFKALLSMQKYKNDSKMY